MRNKVRVFSFLAFFILLLSMSSSIVYAQSHLLINEQLCNEGEKVAFTVSVDKIPNGVERIGFEVEYDPSVLGFSNFKNGSLTQDFSTLRVNLPDGGRLKVSGFTTHPIPAGSSGNIITLTFTVKKCQNSTLTLTHLTDDMTGWSTSNGQLKKTGSDSLPGVSGSLLGASGSLLGGTGIFGGSSSGGFILGGLLTTSGLPTIPTMFAPIGGSATGSIWTTVGGSLFGSPYLPGLPTLSTGTTLSMGSFIGSSPSLWTSPVTWPTSSGSSLFGVSTLGGSAIGLPVSGGSLLLSTLASGGSTFGWTPAYSISSISTTAGIGSFSGLSGSSGLSGLSGSSGVYEYGTEESVVGSSTSIPLPSTAMPLPVASIRAPSGVYGALSPAYAYPIGASAGTGAVPMFGSMSSVYSASWSGISGPLSSSTGSVSSVSIPPEYEGGGSSPQSGTLTAGDIDDNLNMQAFQKYLNSMLQQDSSPTLNSMLQQSSSPILPVVTIADRVTLRIHDSDGQGVSNARVSIYADEQDLLPIIETNAGTNGIFYFFPTLDGAGDETRFMVQVRPPDAEIPISMVSFDLKNLDADRTVDITLEGASASLPDSLDLMLVIDTTGSMSDELKYLTAEFRDIIGAVREVYPDISMRFGLIVYRDTRDTYVVKNLDFTDSVDLMQKQLAEQMATGGGDYPEAVDQAMTEAVSVEWQGGNTARLLFHIADAPPHDNKLQATFDQVKKARRMGLHIYSLAASGVAGTAEYLMRSSACITQGRYLFLTDDSGVGNSHAEPTVPCYIVTRLDQLIIRAIGSELSGMRIEPEKQEIIRGVGSSEAGVCVAD